MKKRYLRHLARLSGIHLSYVNLMGRHCAASDEALAEILESMGVKTTLESEAKAEISRLVEERWRKMLPPVLCVSEQTREIPVRLQCPAELYGCRCEWVLTEEGSRRWRGVFETKELPVERRRAFPSGIIIRCMFPLEVELPMGYHTLEVSVIGAQAPLRASMPLIVAPRRSFVPDQVSGEEKSWGLSLQLYALQSMSNWGIGDFGDLEKVAHTAASLGAGFLGLNPLHALPINNFHEVSPYSPTDRLFLNFLYISIDNIDDFMSCAEVRKTVESEAFQRKLANLRSLPLIPYAEIVKTKREILEKVYGYFEKIHLARKTARGREFQLYVEEGGEELERYARYEALSEHFLASRGEDEKWPECYCDARSVEVAAFAEKHRTRINFYKYIQWQLETQLEKARAVFSAGEKSVGLYLDLALGTAQESAEVWSSPELFARGIEVGAPPDDYNLAGQKWGFPPIIPERLRETGYQAFIRLLRSNMARARALRLDHVMSLQRLFWIPQKGKPADGVYVRYPLADLLSIVSLESVRNKCLVIGEDLGTVSPIIRKAMNERRLFSYKVFFFMRTHDRSFLSEEAYLSSSLVTGTTHDMHTFWGFWAGRDLELRSRLGLLGKHGSLERERESRTSEKRHIVHLLRRRGFLPPENEEFLARTSRPPYSVFLALQRFLARGGSSLLMIPLEDILEQEAQVNLPGVLDGYPCWRHRLPSEIDNLPEDPRLRLTKEAVELER